MNVVTVFAVVEQAHAVAVFGKVGEFVGTDLKLRGIPACIAVGRAFHRAELDFISRFVGVDIDRERGFQNQVFFFPVDVRIKIDAGNVIIQPNLLGDDTVHKRFADFHACTRAVCNGINFRFVGKLPGFFFIVIADFPVVVIARVIFISRQDIAACAGFEHFTVIALVVKPRKRAGFIKLNAEKCVFQHLFGGLHFAAGFIVFDNLIAFRRNIAHKNGLTV